MEPLIFLESKSGDCLFVCCAPISIGELLNCLAHLLDGALSRSAYLGLVDLMMAYAYNHRSTLGENTVESGWTLSKLSNTLAWLEVSCASFIFSTGIACCFSDVREQ